MTTRLTLTPPAPRAISSAIVLPSLNWSRAMPPGPDARVKITEAYAALVARDVYFWAWPWTPPAVERQR